MHPRSLQTQPKGHRPQDHFLVFHQINFIYPITLLPAVVFINTYLLLSFSSNLSLLRTERRTLPTDVLQAGITFFFDSRRFRSISNIRRRGISPSRRINTTSRRRRASEKKDVQVIDCKADGLMVWRLTPADQIPERHGRS